MTPTTLGGAIINTRAFAGIGDLLSLLTRRHGLAVVEGPPGTGKTYAIRAQLEQSGKDAIVAASSPAATTRQLLTVLLQAADTTSDLVGTEPTLRGRLATSVTKVPLLVVDDAHELDGRALKLLRRFCLGPDAHCSLLLVGRAPLTSFVRSQPWARRLLVDLVQIDPLDPRDVAEILPNLHPIYTDADLLALLNADRTFAHGRWSNWARFTRAAVRLRARGDIDTIDSAAAALVLAHVR